jgi:hypothetical protein
MANVSGLRKYFKAGILIQRRTTDTEDAIGNPIEAWITHITINGLIRKTNGTELFVDQKRTGVSYHRLYCEPCDILIGDQVVFQSKTYEITSVNNVMEFDDLYQVDMIHNES